MDRRAWLTCGAATFHHIRWFFDACQPESGSVPIRYRFSGTNHLPAAAHACEGGYGAGGLVVGRLRSASREREGRWSAMPTVRAAATAAVRAVAREVAKVAARVTALMAVMAAARVGEGGG